MLMPLPPSVKLLLKIVRIGKFRNILEFIHADDDFKTFPDFVTQN